MDVKLYQETCCKCNISFWITVNHQKRLVNCKNTFYCPNGHPQSYRGDTDTEKLERYKTYLENAKNDRDMQKRSNAALRGVITRMKNKAEESHD